MENQEIVRRADEQPEQELSVIALRPEDMRPCQDQLIAWAKGKMAAQRLAIKDAEEKVEIARQGHWRRSTYKTQAVAAQKKLEFFEKLKLAFENGYYLVPNFDAPLFAVRTTKKRPHAYASGTSSWNAQVPDEKAQTLPAGVGEYRNPSQLVEDSTTVTKDSKGNEVTHYFQQAVAYKEIEFPFRLARPVIMSATQQAMALKIFDDVGYLPGKTSRQDPLIIGRIRNPSGPSWNPKYVTFMIAWWVTARDLE